MVCNVDHLWSFTRPCFWLDTLRKAVPPPAHLQNLRADLDAYFVSEPGRQKARQCLADRAQEVQAWKSWADRQTGQP